jgi:hypothetical protein
MRKGFLGSIATLLTSVGLTAAQSLPGPEIPAAPSVSPSGSSKPWVGFGARPSADSSAPSTPWYSGFGSPKDTATDKKKADDSAKPAPADGAAQTGFWQPSYHVEEKKPGPADERPVIGPAGISVPDEPNAWDNTPPCGDSNWGREHGYPCSHIWVSAEGLLYWTKDAKLPGPVLTTGGLTNVGTLGFPDTSVFLDSVNFHYGESTGYRFALGCSEADAFSTHTIGFEAVGFFLENRHASSQVGSDANGNPLLSRPIFNPQVVTASGLLGSETVIRVSGPDAFAGHVAFDSTSRLWGLEGNFLCSRMLWGPDIILGARYADLDEGLTITQQTTVLTNGVAGFNGNVVLTDSINGIPSGPPNTLTMVDHFAVRNQFWGGQIGLQNESHLKNFFILWQAKIAFGDNHEHLVINGNTTLSSGGVSQTTTGGVAAVSSNIGSHAHDDFAVLPEGNVSIGFDVTCFLRIYAGYNFLYWSDVVRPGDTVSRVINPGLVPSSLQFGSNTGVNLPAAQFHTSDYWAHGFSFGFALRY